MLPTTASPIDRNALGDGGGVLASGVRESVRVRGAGNRAGRLRDWGSRAGMVSVGDGVQCVMETADGIGQDEQDVENRGNGNVMALVDAAGDVAGEYRYGPYGQTRTATETGIANPFRFSTKFLETAFASEDETLSFGGGLDLYDYGFRWYHAGLGRWTARDPLVSELSGSRVLLNGASNQRHHLALSEEEHLYLFARNNATDNADVLGFRIYAFEGTNYGYFQKSNTEDFFNHTREFGRYYAGPTITSVGMEGGLFDALDDICTDYCFDKKQSRQPVLNFIGWSRGAAAIIEIVNRLNTDGCCCCNGKGLHPENPVESSLCKLRKWKRYRRISVNFAGLYDAVDMSWAVNHRKFSSNVTAGYHAMKTAPWHHDVFHVFFPTMNTGGVQEKFWRYDGAVATHGDLGTRRDNNGAHCWMVRAAQGNGVPVSTTACPWSGYR